MPFTAAHPAIILPLLRLRIFSVSALIMGSMVPDFEFFLRMEAHGPYGHSMYGMFWLNIPVALGFITLYHNFVRNTMIECLPTFFRKRFHEFVDFNWNTYFKANFFKVVMSVIVGNLAHLFWDAFTHFDGFFVSKTPFFNTEYWQIPLYLILQYAFSLIGALSILFFIYKMPTVDLKFKKSDSVKIIYWAIVALVTTVVFVIRFINIDVFHFGERIVCLLSSFIAGLLMASLYGWSKFYNNSKK
jgi:hypothetical protein